MRKGEDPLRYKSADGSPIFKCAVALVRGENLFETLLLNLHRYSQVDAVPMQARNGDPPAWERTRPTEAEDRTPDGYRDLLTWQSRRARLIPERLPNGLAGVSRVVLMKGNQFPDHFVLATAETMTPFRKNNDPKAKSSGWLPLTIRSKRALWRDSAAIFQQAAESAEHATAISLARPRMFAWLGDLESGGWLPHAVRVLDVEVFGIESDRASLSAWRQETLPLPKDYLRTPELAIGIEHALELTEHVHNVLQATAAKFAEIALAPQSNEGGRQADREKGVKPLRDAIDIDSAYWPFLEAPFLDLLRQLPSDRKQDENGQMFAGKARLAAWGSSVHEIANRAMRLAVSSGGTSAWMLKARAEAEALYRHLMVKRMADYTARTQEGVAIESTG